MNDFNIKPPTTLAQELAIAHELAQIDNSDIPSAVKDVISFCINKNIGFILSRNEPADSCKDAQLKRVRHGNIGIPLCDELKTCVINGIDVEGKENDMAVHCCGHKRFAYDKIALYYNLVMKPVPLLRGKILKKKYAMSYGTVNPLLLAARSNGDLLQIFDTDIFKNVMEGHGTMMTNAGAKTWGIEFDPNSIIKATPNFSILPITME